MIFNTDMFQRFMKNKIPSNCSWISGEFDEWRMFVCKSNNSPTYYRTLSLNVKFSKWILFFGENRTVIRNALIENISVG